MRGGRPQMTVPHPSQGDLFVGRKRHVDAALDVFDRTGRRRHDVEVEDFRREVQRCAGIRNIDDAADMALHRGNTENGVGLRTGIAELLQILDRIQAGLTIGDVNVEIMLLALFVDRDAFEDQIILVVRRDRRRLEDRILDAVFGDAVLDDLDLQMQPAGHLDRAAEGDFAVALAEMQVAHRETAARHVNREVDLRTARQILDVAVAAMFARRDRAGTLGGDLGLDVTFGLAGMRCRGEWRVSQRRNARRIGGDQRRLALVPFCQQLRIGQTADQAGMHEAREIDAGYMTRRRVKPLDVPDRLLRQREMLGEEAAAILFREEAVETPETFLLRTDIEQIDHQEVAGLRAFDTDRTGEEMHDRQVDVAHVIGGIVVLDEAAGPIVGLDDEIVAWIDPRHNRNIRMPAVVDHVIFISRLRKIDLDQCLWHFNAPLFYEPCTNQTDRYLEICAASMPSRGSSRTISPFSITSTRSGMSSAKLRTCSETTIERPRSSRIRFKVRAMSLMIDGWIPSVGSSSSSTFGLVASARAIASCCCWPPDRLPPRRSFISNNTGNSS